MSKRVTAGQLAVELARLGTKVPEAVVHSFQEGALLLQGQLVQDAIADSEPHQPVDQGQYKASWRSHASPEGAVVFNLSKQAVWIERGRAPGPVPLGPIVAWVRRHPSMWRSGVAGHRLGQRASFAARFGKSPSMSRHPGVLTKIQAAERARIKSIRKSRREIVKSSAQDAAILEVAAEVALGIKHHGIKPRWVLRRALANLAPRLHKILQRNVRAAHR